MNNIQIKLEAFGAISTVDDVCSNFYEYYPEFSGNMEDETYTYDEKNKIIYIVLEWKF